MYTILDSSLDIGKLKVEWTELSDKDERENKWR